MKRNATTLLALAGMALMTAGFASAETITLTPTADVMVNAWDTSATGDPTATSVQAGYYYGTGYKSMVQFPTWTPGPGESLVSAELKMYFTGSSGEDAGPLALNVWADAADSAWDENTVTYGTLPAVRSGATYGDARFEAGAGPAWTSFGDATSAVQDWTDTGENFGMLLQGQFVNSSWHTIKMFSSSEVAGFEPQLIITYTPEPATMGLLGLGGLALLRRRSRKA